MSQQGAINQARSDFKQGGKGANTTGWNSADRETYNSELKHLQQQAAASNSDRK